MSQVTVKELDELCKQLVALQEQKDVIEETLTEKNKEINAIMFKMADYMKELGREEYHSLLGKFVIEHKERINMPVDDMAKMELFEYLKERGVFEKYATVNSNSINAFYFAERRAAVEERGEDPMLFQIPGLGVTKFETKPTFKPAKKAKT
jgi:ABC-type Fe3+ transport system substrate-binding protein